MEYIGGDRMEVNRLDADKFCFWDLTNILESYMGYRYHEIPAMYYKYGDESNENINSLNSNQDFLKMINGIIKDGKMKLHVFVDHEEEELAEPNAASLSDSIRGGDSVFRRGFATTHITTFNRWATIWWASRASCYAATTTGCLKVSSAALTANCPATLEAVSLAASATARIAASGWWWWGGWWGIPWDEWLWSHRRRRRRHFYRKMR
jgi:hypothetical protein